MQQTNSTDAFKGNPTTAASLGTAAQHSAYDALTAAHPDEHQQLNCQRPASPGLVAGTTASPATSCMPALAHSMASLEAVAAALTTSAGVAPQSSTLGSTTAAAAAGAAAPMPLPIFTAKQPTPHAPASSASIWSNFAAAAANPAFFSHLTSFMVQHQRPSLNVDPQNPGFNNCIDHTAPSSSFAGIGINKTAAAAPAGSHLRSPGSLPGSPCFPQNTLSGSLSNAAAAAAAAFSNASLGTSSNGECCDKSCSHCGKVEQRQWRKRGDGTLLCNRCFMWRRNHGGITLPPLDSAAMQPAITKQHSMAARASSGGGSSHSKHARRSNPGVNHALQDLAGLQDSDQELRHGSRHARGSYSAPSSPGRPCSRSSSAAASPARRRRAGGPDDPEYRPRGASQLNRSSSHASDDYGAAAAAAAGPRSSAAGHSMQEQQHNKLRPRSRLAKAGGSGAWGLDEDAGVKHASDHDAAGRKLQHQGSSSRSRLAAAAAAAASAESDEEVVNAAEVLAGLLPMGCYKAVESHAEQQQAITQSNYGLAAAAAAAPLPTSTAAHPGGNMQQQVHQQALAATATDNRSVGAAAGLQRSGPGSIVGSWMGHPSSAGELSKGGMGATASPALKSAAPTAACKDQLLNSCGPQQHGGLSTSASLSPVAAAKAEQARAAAAAGTINPHVYRAILTALAAGAAAESIDLVSTQRKFEVMEQQLHVPHSPAAAHLLSRMNGRSS